MQANEGKLDSNYVNKQRCLVFCSRGIIPRYRHLLEDFRKLIPHHKKDVKVRTTGSDLNQCVVLTQFRCIILLFLLLFFSLTEKISEKSMKLQRLNRATVAYFLR